MMESEITTNNPKIVPELVQLRKIIESPPDHDNEYTRVKKDLFHAFHMLPIPVNHGIRLTFLRMLRDHLMRWDPTSRTAVDKVCRKHFNLTFDEMLARNPCFITLRTPRHVPPPSVLVPAIDHVYHMFHNAKDVKTVSLSSPISSLQKRKLFAILPAKVICLTLQEYRCMRRLAWISTVFKSGSVSEGPIRLKVGLMAIYTESLVP